MLLNLRPKLCFCTRYLPYHHMNRNFYFAVLNCQFCLAIILSCSKTPYQKQVADLTSSKLEYTWSHIHWEGNLPRIHTPTSSHTIPTHKQTKEICRRWNKIVLAHIFCRKWRIRIGTWSHYARMQTANLTNAVTSGIQNATNNAHVLHVDVFKDALPCISGSCMEGSHVRKQNAQIKAPIFEHI